MKSELIHCVAVTIDSYKVHNTDSHYCLCWSSL